MTLTGGIKTRRPRNATAVSFWRGGGAEMFKFETVHSAYTGLKPGCAEISTGAKDIWVIFKIKCFTAKSLSKLWWRPNLSSQVFACARGDATESCVNSVIKVGTPWARASRSLTSGGCLKQSCYSQNIYFQKPKFVDIVGKTRNEQEVKNSVDGINYSIK